MTVCPGCAAEGQHEGARFCFSCGLPLQAPGCASCGFELAPGSRFCPSCGTPQSGAAPAPAPPSPVASRRITSVLFGDLVGFTALSESRDQEDVRELLSNYFESCSQVIARYGGTVEKFIGDAVMAVWGVPTAHEDDAERAVRAGLELVNLITALGTDLGVPGLAMRVGIVTGEVAVTIGATQQGMVAGDAVNTAARVQTAALPGQVWVDETTRLLTSSAVTYADVGSHAMKGKADPMPLWSVRAIVAGMGGSQRADGLEAPHVGRDRELRLVKELFHGAEETHRPALLVVSGDAGVGKSRLGWEFFKYVDGLTRGSWWHQGRCLSYGEGVAFYALAEAIRARLHNVGATASGPTPSQEGHPDHLEERLVRFVPDAEEREWLQPRLGALLGVNAVGSYKREDLFTAWTTFLHRVSDDGDPVILLIDDAQHADDGLLDFVEHLLAVGTFPCFVVLLARPSLLEKRPTLTTNRRASVIHLDELTPTEMSTLLDGLVTGLPAPARAALVRRAEGIPLYAVETVRSLIDRDLVLPRGGQYVLADPTTLDLDAIAAPASLQALIAARLDALPPEHRRVVDAASVLGTAFTRDHITALCPDHPDLDAALAGLVRVQLLSQESSRFSTELGQYRFVQAGVRQVAYGTLSRRDRKASHLAVVRQLEAEDDPADELAPIIAQHYLEAVDAVPDESDGPELTAAAVQHLKRAATRAGALGAHAEAKGHLSAALARVVEPDERAPLQLELARRSYDLGEHVEAAQHAIAARDAFDLLGNRVAAASAVTVLVRAHNLAYDFDAALHEAEGRVEDLRAAPDATVELLGLLRAMGAAQLYRSEPFGDLATEVLLLAEAVDDENEMADAYILLSLHYSRVGARSISRTLMQSAADIAHRRRDQRLLASALVNLAATWITDDMDRAIEVGREALLATKVINYLPYRSICAVNLCLALILRGDWSEAAELLESDEVSDLDVLYWEFAGSYLSWARGENVGPAAGDTPVEPEAGDVAAAVRSLTEAFIRARAGDPAAATLAVTGTIQAHQVLGLQDDCVVLMTVASELARHLGDFDALSTLDALVDAHPIGVPPRAARAVRLHHRALESMRDGSAPSVVESHLRRALHEAGNWGSGLIATEVSVDLGLWLRDQGRVDEADGLLDAARTHFEQMSAVVQLADLEARVRVPDGSTPERVR